MTVAERIARRISRTPVARDRPLSGDGHGGVRWFLAEFLVVVTGVLVALAVNAWWQGRTDVARERAFLHQLLADFRANAREVERFVARENEVAASADRFYRAAHLPLPPADSLRRWLAGSLYLPPLELRTATWEALVQGGAIGLIRSDSLRNRLVHFAGQVAYARNRLDPLTHAGFDGITLIFRRVDVFEITDTAARRARGWDDLHSQFPPRWQQLLADHEFVSVVETTGRAAAGRASVIGTLLEPIRQITALLETELEQ